MWSGVFVISFHLVKNVHSLNTVNLLWIFNVANCKNKVEISVEKIKTKMFHPISQFSQSLTFAIVWEYIWRN